MAKIKDKHGQQEMVGFAMIVILVAIIVLVLLGISLNKPKTTTGVKSYEVESFIQASLQHTTDCSTDFGQSYADVGDLITECDREQVCEDGRLTCDVLETTLKDILKSSWPVGEDLPAKGYAMNITSDNAEILSLNSGNVTSNYRGGTGERARRGSTYLMELKVYY